MTERSYQHILLCGAATQEGTLALTSKGIEWRGSDTDRKVTIPSASISQAEWTKFGRTAQLWVVSGTGEDTVSNKFDGFRPTDFDDVASRLRSMGDIELSQKRLGTRGGNWANGKVEHKNLILRDDKKQTVAELPLEAVTQCAIAGKNEVELQFQEDDTAAKEDEGLVEMRLFVPPEHKLNRSGDAAGVDLLRESIVSAAGIRGVSGEAIAELDESMGLFLTPRGRYQLLLYGSMFRMVGKTYDFKIAYRSIARMFYLPRPPTGAAGTVRTNFVISLDDPLRHRQQRYPHLVMQLDDSDTSVPINMDEEEREAQFPGLGSHVSGTQSMVVAKVFKTLTGKRVFRPGSFETTKKAKALRCSLKSNDGLLFPLDKSFFFVHKPATYIRYTEIDSATIERYSNMAGVSSRTFDLHLKCRSIGGQPGREFVFSGIDRNERNRVVQFLRDRNVRVISDEELTQTRQSELMQAIDEEVAQEDEERKAELPAANDEDSEEDEDFQEGSSDSSSDSGGSQDESGSGSDDDEDAPKKHKKAPKRKREQSRGGDGDEDDAPAAKKSRTSDDE